MRDRVSRGHELFLEHSANANFCDCGAGDFKRKGGVSCVAPFPQTIAPQFPNDQNDAESPDVKVGFRLRGDLELEVSIFLENHPDPEMSAENDGDESEDDDDLDLDNMY